MGWETSRRRGGLPKNWAKLRAEVLKRAHNTCEHIETKTIYNLLETARPTTTITTCNNAATDVDHIKRGNNHNTNNLQALCKKHHKQKTQHEANSAYKEKYNTRQRIPEQHPGRN